ncbi:MAG: hypothetical protein AVDCRST_MAG72-665, partial [uncultured Nocardioidaceae bacterium]
AHAPTQAEHGGTAGPPGVPRDGPDRARPRSRRRTDPRPARGHPRGSVLGERPVRPRVGSDAGRRPRRAYVGRDARRQL